MRHEEPVCGATIARMNRNECIARAREEGKLYEVPNRAALDSEKHRRASVVLVGSKIVKNRYGTIDYDRSKI